jgi:hypothetical protein
VTAVGGEAESTLVGLVSAPLSGVECCNEVVSSRALDTSLGS